MYINQGKLEEAAECYRQAVLANPVNGEAHCSLGMVYLQQNSFADAEHYLRQAVSADPKFAQAFYFLGSTQLRQGKLGEAADNFNKARELKPDAEIIYSDLCYTLFQLGQYAAAKNIIMQGLAINPNFADFHFFLGTLYGVEQEVDKAIGCYQKTLVLQPNHYGAYVNYAKLLQGQGKLDEAITCFHKALALEPGLIDAYDHLARIYNEQGRQEEVIACYLKALALKPDSAEIYHNLGLASKITGQLDEAVSYYKKALELRPDLADAYVNLGNVFFEQAKLNEAESSYRKGLELKPDLSLACFGLAITLAARKKYPDSISCFRRVLELEPDHVSARVLLFHQLQHICEWKDWEANVQAVHQAAGGTQQTKGEFTPFSLLPLPGTTAKEQKHCAERYAQLKFRSIAALRHKLGFDFKRPPNEKIRIGYLSSDFRQHPVSFLTAEIFELHDRGRFHVTAYSYGPDDNSAMRKRLEKAFDSFVDIRNDSYESAAKKIYADRIDILVDLSGYTENCRSEILALRPAPVQVNYLGYPGTMGADFIDYMIADRFTIPQEMRQHYTEEIVWMPDCFQANDSARARPSAPARAECGLPENAMVFCCFNQTFKITPELFGIWCRLLLAVPGSVLWLPASTPEAEANLRREAVSRGVASERIVMAPLVKLEDHLARLQCADLFLDTLPFNAGTTCSDALWMGLPVITCAGDAFASRMAGSLLTAIGAPELITYNLDDYYRLALDFASNREKLDAVRSKIAANRNTAPLFDSERFTRNLEHAYVEMMSARARGGMAAPP